MFVSHEKNVGKKTFQKPNILRRKPKVAIPRPNVSNVNESPQSISLVKNGEKANISYSLDKITKDEISKKSTNLQQSIWNLKLTKDCGEKDVQLSQETAMNANIKTDTLISSNVTQNVDKSLEPISLNIESFINGGGGLQYLPLHNIDAASSPEQDTSQDKTKWSFDMINNSMDIIIENYSEPQSEEIEQRQKSVIVVPSAPALDFQQPSLPIQEQVSNLIPPQTTSVDCFSNRAVKYKCDHPNCNKGFWSEERLKKHKNSHNRPVVRPPTQAPIECPVKKVTAEGSVEGCLLTFKMRSDVIKHLNEDHTLEDAVHRCDVCGRRFFWASGLRAHGASRCARGGLACGWPGCGRVFRLPCRLREHARAHTGDRPYRCRYPECGWAFRSASKLVRHARRHTDERRHACAECGRAFLRREHLRDHAARHHLPSARAAHLCAHPGCEQSFSNMSTLYMHMKKVHRKEVIDSVASIMPDETPVKEDGDNIYLVSLVAESPGAGKNAELEADTENADQAGDVEEAGGAGHAECVGHMGGAGQAGGAGQVAGVKCGGAGGAGGVEWHAARTHCTWPLPRHTLQHHYVLDDDANVERAEGSGSDVYTVRSDLFLHGNVPIDEDSQHMGGVAGGSAAPLEPDLCLIDAHPTIDLMQEELMYEDAAVDESTFRVFLMNGEELT